jgi:hypothetical protein
MKTMRKASGQHHILTILPLRKIPQYLLDGPQEQSGCCGVETNLLPLLGIE